MNCRVDREGSSCLVLAQVEEMAKAVDVAEKNMARFGLSQAEISSRRKWVLQTRRQVRAAASLSWWGAPRAPV